MSGWWGSCWTRLHLWTHQTRQPTKPLPFSMPWKLRLKTNHMVLLSLFKVTSFVLDCQFQRANKLVQLVETYQVNSHVLNSSKLDQLIACIKLNYIYHHLSHLIFISNHNIQLQPSYLIIIFSFMFHRCPKAGILKDLLEAKATIDKACCQGGHTVLNLGLRCSVSDVADGRLTILTL